MQGREEYLLSEAGRRQAAARGRSLKSVLAGSGKTLVFTSPLCRARETAEIIAKEASLPEPVSIEELMEMSIGIWTGKNIDKVKKDDPVLWDKFMARSWDAIPEAESSSVLYSRALKAWALLRDAAAEQGAGNVIAVTHGGLLQWLLKSSFQSRTWFPLFPISNCGLSKLCVEPKGQSVYMYWEEINSLVPD